MGKVIIIGFIVLCVVFFAWVALLPDPDKVKAQKEAEKRRHEYLSGERCPHCGSTEVEDITGEELDLLLKIASCTRSSSDGNARYSLSFPKRCKHCENVFWV